MAPTPARWSAGSALVLIGAAVVSTTAACGSIRSGLGGGTDAANACQVLTLDLAKPVIGDNAVQSISAQPNPRETHCQYKGQNGWIDAMVGEWSVIHLVSEPNEQPVAGIGDAAYTSFSGLKVRKGKHGMQINVVLTSGDSSTRDDRQLQAEKDLAAKMLPKL
ncbi:hypothetical protein [Mycobacterium sp. 1164966.3]|uniref:hypothetical protein n=1 Tax=Mycobacterium sp. 1164966.3 TaxID=1856861 RepID=UPI0012E87042|nr:hypothetical protein [Mycobacterium sp. 1164966.3]